MKAASPDQRRRAEAVAVSVVRRASDAGVELPDTLRLWALVRSRPVPGSGSSDGPALATVLEAATPARERRTRGLHVTPEWLADHLVSLALDGLDVPAADLTFCDPACGGGAFLLAAARALEAQGVSRGDVVRHHLWGADVDPVGLATAEAALALWAGESPPPSRLVLADPLSSRRRVWPDGPPEGFAAVVGNPPFLNQLGRATVRSPSEVTRLRRRFGSAVQPYTDAAWLFLLLGAELARPGGRVALVQPMSVVGARDAAAVRDALDARAELRHLWVEDRRAFAASVQVCAPVLAVGPGSNGARGGGMWASRLADAMGVPPVHVSSAVRLGDCAEVTAGFRDEYYGLVPLVREAEPGEAGRALLTVGTIDWGRSAWGERTTTFAKRRWQRPVVDVTLADPDDQSAVARGGARWIARVSAPKVVVATQTRVVEAAVDETGAWVPSVPALVVLPHAEGDLWRLAAAISSPTATAWLLRRTPGTALSRQAMKMAASDLAQLPLPGNDEAWDHAADALRVYATEPQPAAFERFAAAAAVAYDAPLAVTDWWRERF